MGGKLLKTKVKIFYLFLVISLFIQAAGNNKEFIVDDSVIVLALAWIAGIVIITLLLRKRKYKKAGLILAQENINLEERIKKLEKELKNEQKKVFEVEKMDLLEAVKKTDELNKKILKLELKKEKINNKKERIGSFFNSFFDISSKI